MNKHTPGPWKAHFHVKNKTCKTGEWVIFGANGFPVLSQYKERSENEAQLLAAAPELAEALKECAEYMDVKIAMGRIDEHSPAWDIWKKSIAALKKAGYE